MNWIKHIESLPNPLGLASFYMDHIFSDNIHPIMIDVVLILTVHGFYIFILTLLFKRFVIETKIGRSSTASLFAYLVMILLVIASHVGDIFVLTLVLEALKLFPDPLTTFHYVSGMYTTIGSNYSPGPNWQSLSMLISFTGLFAFSISGSGLYSMLGYFLASSNGNAKVQSKEFLNEYFLISYFHNLMSKLYKFIMTLSAVIFFGYSYAQSEQNPIPKINNDWQFSVTPYVWTPGIMATLNMNNNAVNTADYSSSNVLSNLKSGAMITGEARKGRWGVLADTFFATLQHGGSFSAKDKSGNVRVGDSVTLQETILTGAALYNLHTSSNISVDGLLGVRAIYSTASMKLNVIGTSLKENSSTTMSTVDPIAGFKGRYRIAESTWYLPFYADIGGGGGTTNMTWQAMLGVGKSINKVIDVSASYRALYYDMHGTGLLMKTTMKGPQIALTFNF